MSYQENHIKKESIIRNIEPFVRSYFHLGNNPKGYHFNKEKLVINGNADLWFWNEKNKVYTDAGTYCKFFVTENGYSIPNSIYKRLLKSKNLDYIIFYNEGFYIFIDKTNFSNITFKTKTVKGFDFEIISFNDESLLNNANLIYRYIDNTYGFLKEAEKDAIAFKNNTNLKPDVFLPSNAFLLPDKHYGKDYLVIKGDKGAFTNVSAFLKKLIKENNSESYENIKARFYRYIKNCKKSIDNNEIIKPFINDIYVFDTEVFDSIDDFQMYQMNAIEHVNKTENIKSYQKDYQKDYQSRLCVFEGKEYKYDTLVKKFKRMGIIHPSKEASKYLKGINT